MFQATIERYRTAYAGLPREVWLLALVMFVNRCGTMVLPFMTLYLTSQRGMSEAAAGWMIALYGVGAVCGAYLGGRLAARVGAIRLQTFCLFLAVPGYWALGAWEHWIPIAANLLCLAVVAEGVRTANQTAIASLAAAENRTRAFALNRLAANLGFSFGPLIGGGLATIDFGLLFVVDALTTLAAALAMLAFFGLRNGHAANQAELPAVKPDSPLRDRTFVAFLALFLANLIVFFQFLPTYPLYLRDHFRLTPPLIGVIFGVNTTVIVLVEMVLIDSVKHWPLVRTIGWGCFLSCLGFGMLPFGSSMAYAVLAMVVVTIGEMLSFALSAGFVASRSRPGNEGVYMGWYMMTFALASVLGPSIGSAIYGVNPDALWWCALAVGVGVLAGFKLLASRNSATVGELPEVAARSLSSEDPQRGPIAAEPMEAAVLANVAD